jgi:two-component system response regulator PrrA
MPEILIVEDDLAIRKMFARTLSPLGRIDEASNGLDAVKLLDQKKYDAILLDMHMSGLDGAGVLDDLEAKKGLNERTPVFVITADPSVYTRAQAIHRSRFYLQKPVKLALLAMLVTGVLPKAGAPPPSRPSAPRR